VQVVDWVQDGVELNGLVAFQHFKQ
jgi:hypothetical protein